MPWLLQESASAAVKRRGDEARAGAEGGDGAEARGERGAGGTSGVGSLGEQGGGLRLHSGEEGTAV